MITKYITYLRQIKGYSENTCQAYEKDLRKFALWMKNNKEAARWSTITREDLDDYLSVTAATLKPSTTNRQLASLSSFYKYLKRQGYEIENPCKYESRRKVGETVPNTIPYKDLEAAYEKANGITQIMLGLLITTGIRIQELLDITWEDINFDTCCIKIKGKGKQERVVWTLPDNISTLESVMRHYHPSGLVFTIDQRTARKMIYDSLKPYSKAKQLSPHAIRHTFATHLAETGVNTTTLSKALGHKHLETTQKYIDYCQVNVKKAFQENSLLS